MPKCVICFGYHTNMWDDGPNMYCEQCVPIREAARGVANHIQDNLYLGDMKAAGSFDGLRMCVHEAGPHYEGQCIFLPVLTTRPFSKWDRTGAIASIERLDEAAEVIQNHVAKGDKILVHCMGGIERSPLTIAWWMKRTNQVHSIQDAYKFLQAKRPAVSERLFWLSQDHKWFREIP